MYALATITGDNLPGTEFRHEIYWTQVLRSRKGNLLYASLAFELNIDESKEVVWGIEQTPYDGIFF